MDSKRGEVEPIILQLRVVWVISKSYQYLFLVTHFSTQIVSLKYKKISYPNRGLVLQDSMEHNLDTLT